MKHITTFLLGCFFAISIAATTTNLMTVKPAMPKETVVFYKYDYDEAEQTIKNCIEEGYILKSINVTSHDMACVFVVMEKY